MRTFRFLSVLLFALAAWAGEWAEVRNADNTVLRVVVHPADWSPTNVAHTFGPEHQSRFVLVTNLPAPTHEPILYTLTPTNRLGGEVLERDWTVTRLATTNIVDNLKAETERRVRLVVSLSDATNLLARTVELQDKQLAGETLTEAEAAQYAAIRAIWSRAKAIRTHGAALIAQAETLTEVGGWPE